MEALAEGPCTAGWNLVETCGCNWTKFIKQFKNFPEESLPPRPQMAHMSYALKKYYSLEINLLIPTTDRSNCL